MIIQLFAVIETVQRELLLFSGIWLLIGAIDDLAVDLIWIFRRGYRRMAYYYRQPPQRAHQLAPSTHKGLLAIFIPAWNEAAVIGAMLDTCTQNWNDSECEHRIYVGCYPNDPASVASVETAMTRNPRIRVALVGHAGPTTKADCLNRLWQALLTDEQTENFTAKAVILHDAEDAVHQEELRIFDRLLAKGGAVQLPVIPIPTTGSRWISGHYCDEFAEAHGKTMVVREALGARLPLAGVACAIDRKILGKMVDVNGGKPFDEGSLTEDYELGLRIGSVGGRTIMARLLDQTGELVGTRACFPDTLNASVRQKARWLTGISLAGWDRLGWQGNFAQKWMLAHDRRSILAAIVLMAAYISIILTAVLLLAEANGWHQPTKFPEFLAMLLLINAIFLLWRLGVRAAFVASIYGPIEALLSVPRSLVANIIAIMAARRACLAYIRHIFGGTLKWDKTTHHVVPFAAAKAD